jgi:hypothetical protein
MTWLTAADLLVDGDERIIGEFLSDDGDMLTRDEILSSTILTDASNGILARAMGRVEAALLSGGRYTTLDMARLTVGSLAYLKEIGSVVALSILVKRRIGLHAEFAKGCWELAESHLESLRTGKELFTLADPVTNLTDGSVEQAAVVDTSLLTWINCRDINTLADQCYKRFPDRSQRLPYARAT